MKPISFPEQNIVFGANQPEYQPLPAFIGSTSEAQAVTCWQLTWKERLILLITGRIWLQLLTFHKPLMPIFITVEKNDIFIPLVETPEDGADFTELDNYCRLMSKVPRFNSVIKSYWSEMRTRYVLTSNYVSNFYLEYSPGKRAHFVCDPDYQSDKYFKYCFSHFEQDGQLQ